MEGREELKSGDILGPYQLLLPIARGGMAQIWAGRLSDTPGMPGLVAVKTILPINEEGQLESMLFDEAALASAIHHPNVARTLDLGEQNGTIYLVMEWIHGEPLELVMRAAHPDGIPQPIAVHLIAQACQGLQAAHEAKGANGEPLGIVHRDVSPQNLLVTYAGVVKLIDFGVAKARQRITQTTATGEVKGKFAYMAPEQVHGKELDARADLFAMGIVLYRATTGVHPFKADNPAATITNILSRAPSLPSEIVPSYPPKLEAVVMKALSKDKADRFASAEEMRLALEAAVPEATHPDIQKATVTLLRSLFEKRIAERADALQRAVRAADLGARGSIGRGLVIPVSQSTMRAVSVDGEAEGAADSEVSLPPTASAAPPARVAKGRLALVAAVALAAGVTWVARALRPAGRAQASAGVESGALDTRPLPAPIASTATPAVDAGERLSSPVPAPATSASVSAVLHRPSPIKKRDHGSHEPEDTSSPPNHIGPSSSSTSGPAVEGTAAPSEGDPLSRRK